MERFSEEVEQLSNIKSFDEFLFEFIDTMQRLSGVMVIIDDKILLVKPQKYKNMTDKWSIPKGKIEDKQTILDTAVKELEEETGIKLTKQRVEDSEKKKIFYKKSGKMKELNVYIVRLNKEDLQVDITKKWSVHKKHFDNDEVYKAKFFSKGEASIKLEMGQESLLKLM